MLSQHSKSQALVKEEGCDRRGEPTLNLTILMEMKPERNKVVETERGDVRGIQGKGYQKRHLEGRIAHKQHVREDGNQHSEDGLRCVWSNQRK